MPHSGLVHIRSHLLLSTGSKANSRCARMQRAGKTGDKRAAGVSLPSFKQRQAVDRRQVACFANRAAPPTSTGSHRAVRTRHRSLETPAESEPLRDPCASILAVLQ